MENISYDGVANKEQFEAECAHAEQAGVPAEQPAEQPAEIAALLDNLPGIIGGIDWAIHDKTGTPMPFVLLVFSGNTAAHAQNFDAKEANRLIVHFARQVAESDPDAAAILKGD